MSTHIKMTDIRRGAILIPGGWSLKLPEIRGSPEDVAVFVAYFAKAMGTKRAEAFVAESFQEVFNRGWLQGLREMIADRAEEFIRMGGELESFKPEAIAAAYVPFENRGRRGKPVVKKMLLEMMHKEEEVADD